MKTYGATVHINQETKDRFDWKTYVELELNSRLITEIRSDLFRMEPTERRLPYSMLDIEEYELRIVADTVDNWRSKLHDLKMLLNRYDVRDDITEEIFDILKR